MLLDLDRVNDRSEMIAAMDMGLKAIMTDKPGSLKALQQECSEDWPKVKAELGYTFGWFTPRYYSVVDVRFSSHPHSFPVRLFLDFFSSQRYRGRAFEALLRYAAGSFDGKGGTPPASSFAL